MQRGVSQLLFNYLPYRTVDWEDGLAIVQLGNVRFSSIWEEDRKTTLLQEMGESFERWVAKGGTIDPAFPDPKQEPERYTAGSPESIDAAVLPAALICQRCGQLIFDKKFHKHEKSSCPNCQSPRIHQIPFVFVHGCGELVPIEEWMPATRKNTEIRGARAHEASDPMLRNAIRALTSTFPDDPIASKDMKVVCRKCNIEVLDRFTARCHRCLKRFTREGTYASRNESSGTIVSALAMRLARIQRQ